MANANVKILVINRRNDGSGYDIHLATAHSIHLTTENLYANKIEQNELGTHGKFVALINTRGVSESPNTLNEVTLLPNQDRLIKLSIELANGGLFKVEGTHSALFQIMKHHNTIPVRVGIDVPSYLFFDGNQFLINTPPINNENVHFSSKDFVVSAKTLTHKGKLHYVIV